MKRYLAIAAILAATTAPAQAQGANPSTCMSLANIVASTAEARDRGVPLSQVLGIVNQLSPNDRVIQAVAPSLRRTIVLLYQHPQIGAKDAGQAFYAGCVR
jgi:hypothetical protein